MSVDLDESVGKYYLSSVGERPPKLSMGDVVDPLMVTGHRTDHCTVVGFRSGGMLVDCVQRGIGQVYCVPRFQDPGGWLVAL